MANYPEEKKRLIMIWNKALFRKKGYIILGIAGIILIFSSCSSFFLSPKNIEIKKHLSSAEELLKQGKYDLALKKNKLIEEKYPENPWQDEVFFNLGCLFAYYDNPQKNFGKAKIYFQRIVREFPQSSFQKESQVWLAILNELLIKEEEINRIEKEVNRKEKEINSLRQKIKVLEKEKCAILISMSQEIFLKNQEIEELEKKIHIQEIAINLLQAQMKKIKEIDIQLEKKKKDVKE
jgi:outer membrane protein assembly factor BamD (BamD/ComL family)